MRPLNIFDGYQRNSCQRTSVGFENLNLVFGHLREFGKKSREKVEKPQFIIVKKNNIFFVQEDTFFLRFFEACWFLAFLL